MFDRGAFDSKRPCGLLGRDAPKNLRLMFHVPAIAPGQLLIVILTATAEKSPCATADADVFFAATALLALDPNLDQGARRVVL